MRWGGCRRERLTLEWPGGGPRPGAGAPAGGGLRRAGILLASGAQQRGRGVEQVEPAWPGSTAELVVAATENPGCDWQESGRRYEKIVAPCRPSVRDGT